MAVTYYVGQAPPRAPVPLNAPTKTVATTGGGSGRPPEGKMFPRGTPKKG